MPPADEVRERRSLVRALESRRDFPGVVRELAGLDRAALLAEPDLGYSLAVALQATGDTDRALDLVESLGEPVRRSGVGRLGRRLLNLEGALRFGRGDVGRARDLWERVLSLATAGEDHDLVARSSNNLGVLHTLQGRPRDAIAAYGRALAANQRLGDRRGLAQAHQNLAINYRESDRPEEADTHFRLAMDHAREADSPDVLGRAEEERAVLFLRRGDLAMARESAVRARDRFERIGDATGRAESLRVLGLIALAAGRLEEATARLETALAEARSTSSALLEAETLECLAGVRHAAGDPASARAARGEAAALFERLGAEAWGARLRERVRSYAS